jgi:hypothetical protein
MASSARCLTRTQQVAKLSRKCASVALLISMHANSPKHAVALTISVASLSVPSVMSQVWKRRFVVFELLFSNDRHLLIVSGVQHECDFGYV